MVSEKDTKYFVSAAYMKDQGIMRSNTETAQRLLAMGLSAEQVSKAYPALREGTAERRYSARYPDSPHREASRRGNHEEGSQLL